MIAVKASVIVKNCRIVLELPEGFDGNDEVEVIVLSGNIDETRWSLWSDEELARIGRIGMSSQSIIEEDEDYSAW